MVASAKNSLQLLQDRLRIPKPWDKIIILALNLLITVPLFIIIHQNITPLNWPYALDKIGLFLLLLVVLQLLLVALRRITFVSIALYIVFLLWGTLIGDYGFGEVYSDYESMIYTMQDNPYPQDIVVDKLLPFPNKTKITKAITFDHAKVRNFAIMAANKHFKNIKQYPEYTYLIQYFAVFKEINSRWYYVKDPVGHEYIATADESLNYLSGDCDDHSILMAAAVKSIGGIPRLIHTQGHIYPELYVGTYKDMEKVNFLIKKVLFPKESQHKSVHYHIDERGNIWLNLDYTAKYPGGPFMKEEILSALTLN
ncbi:transglutaminase [Flavobacterium sp. N1719]|uniref:transglutaminase n=1 Tax=Flavobacterium sp. N1719 TaxID=2885633 RepID=UPI00222137B1|nr:transglutaminase [Flavobacterium sp. N1719]